MCYCCGAIIERTHLSAMNGKSNAHIRFSEVYWWIELHLSSWTSSLTSHLLLLSRIDSNQWPLACHFHVHTHSHCHKEGWLRWTQTTLLLLFSFCLFLPFYCNLFNSWINQMKKINWKFTGHRDNQQKIILLNKNCALQPFIAFLLPCDNKFVLVLML